RDDAHRTAGTVDELDVHGQQVIDAVPVDRVGVTAADLHQLVMPSRFDEREDLAGERPPERGVPELVHEPHVLTHTFARGAPAAPAAIRPSEAMAVPACTNSVSPGSG